MSEKHPVPTRELTRLGVREFEIIQLDAAGAAQLYADLLSTNRSSGPSFCTHRPTAGTDSVRSVTPR